jgi:hypothetical protein
MNSQPRTVIGLFEDILDVRTVLEWLRKSDYQPEFVSVVLYDSEAPDDVAADRHGGVTDAPLLADLNSASQWLTRLTSVIVPERGHFLVSGPFGIALANLNPERADRGLPARSALAHALCGFGFSVDEATYVDHRLTAGSLLVGVTSDDTSHLSATQERFGDNNAVYLGTAATDNRLISSVAELLVAPPEISDEGTVVVVDAVAQLIGLCGSSHPLASLCGRQAVDRHGHDVGTIEEVIADTDQSTEETASRVRPRYLILAHGGVLGIGRKRTAVPVGQASLDRTPVTIDADRETIQRAPSWDADAPFSRREEHQVYTYFGAEPHWVIGSE